MNDASLESATGMLPTRRESRRHLLGALGGALVALTAIATAGRSEAPARSPQATSGKRRRGKHRGGPGGGPGASCDMTAASGIAGQVTIGPICPVVREDEPCPDRPYAATLVIRDAAGRKVCTVQSGGDGRFRVGLPPGRYELEPISGNPGGLPFAASQTVTVEPNTYTDVAVSFDSGIR